MDADRFDHWTRSLIHSTSRRDLLRGLGAALGLASTRIPDVVAAKKNKKDKTPAPNAFGCLNIGQKCRGRGDLCCSGICAGKKPKKGKKDKRKCVAHNTGGCVAEQDSCAVGKIVPCGALGECTRTTGQATFCGLLGSGVCTVCTKDSDCLLSGPGAACIVCPIACPQTTTACIAAAA